MQKILFTPFTINGLTFKNRTIRSATNDYLADRETGTVTSRQIDLYTELARGKVGGIISGFLFIHPSGKSSPGQTGIFSDNHVSGLSELTRAVHKEGGKIIAQLVHGGRQARPKYCGGEVIAPSKVEDTKTRIIPREMTEKEIHTMVQWFIDGAVRSKEAGFDGIQLHGAHGYLLSQFISPHTNRRQDSYGGTTENRCRILIDIIQGIREKLGDKYPLMIKLNTDDFIPGGLVKNESARVAEILDRNGIDAIEISGGMVESEGSPTTRKDINSPEEEAYFKEYADAVRSHVKCPLILVGGIRSIDIMENILSRNSADMVALCRPFIREPDLIRKLEIGEQTKAACISCNKCFNPRGLACPYRED